MKRYDAIVAGGGPAGAALSIELAAAGRSVVLFEREKGPHDKVCGEFVSREGEHYLGRLGISLGALGSLPVERVRLVRKGSAITAPLPFRAQSLSRRILDEALLERAAATGVEVRRGVRVKGLAHNGSGWSCALESGATVHAPDAFLATGKHDLRELKRPPGRQPDLIGFKCYWHLATLQAKELEGQVELILFPGGYAGLQPVEGHRANLCLLVRKGIFAETYQTWERLLPAMMEASPHLQMRLSGATPSSVRPLAITGLPYGYVGSEATGPWRLGDQAVVIPSFSGDGMSIALHSAYLAAQFYLLGETAASYQRRLAQDVSRQVWRATAISKILVTRHGQLGATAIIRAMPQLMPLLAALTRIPDRAMNQAGAKALLGLHPAPHTGTHANDKLGN